MAAGERGYGHREQRQAPACGPTGSFGLWGPGLSPETPSCRRATARPARSRRSHATEMPCNAIFLPGLPCGPGTLLRAAHKSSAVALYSLDADCHTRTGSGAVPQWRRASAAVCVRTLARRVLPAAYPSPAPPTPRGGGPDPNGTTSSAGRTGGGWPPWQGSARETRRQGSIRLSPAMNMGQRWVLARFWGVWC